MFPYTPKHLTAILINSRVDGNYIRISKFTQLLYDEGKRVFMAKERYVETLNKTREVKNKETGKNGQSNT
jgi:hypothetical protein